MGRSNGGVLCWLLAYLGLFFSYSLALLVCRLGSTIPYRRLNATRRIAVIGTFHNPNWFLSHVVPLSRSGADKVLVITDQVLAAPENVRFLCPQTWLSKAVGRALAKFIWLVICAVRYKPDIFIGYHILPGSLTALIVARLFGRPACYQMTAGPIEIRGGGAHTIGNPLMSLLARPSPFLERLAMAVIRQFDLVVVRGSKAKDFLAERGLEGSVTVITGSVNLPTNRSGAVRYYDLVHVGQLIGRKQPVQFLEITAAVKRLIPSVRGAVVGDGPLLDNMRQRAAQLGVDGCIEFFGKRQDVTEILARSKIFVLTSVSEGLSIAMAEAMAAGAVPIVADVGDLADLVTDGLNGYLVKPNQLQQYVERIVSLLRDRDLRLRQAHAAAEAALRHSGVDVVTAKWARSLRDVIGWVPETGTAS